MSERESFLRRFHDAHPGITASALARAGSYERLAARVPAGDVLDLACGDGTLLRLLGPRAIGIDLSRNELALAPCGCVVQARAQQLPFRDACFDAATCHLAFMLFDAIEAVVAELSRVLRPGARFLALLGGGPAADGDDAFHHFARLLPRGSGFGDRRASSEAGWRELFAGWGAVTFERWPLDLGGSFDEVWRFLGASYQLADAERVRTALAAAFPSERVPCTVVTYLATVTR